MVDMGKERKKHWQMTEERAKQLYETIQSSLDPSTWKVPVNSQRREMTMEEFREYAKKRLNYNGSDPYQPTLVATDCLMILEALYPAFDNIRARLEDSFKGILIANESMGSYFDGIHTEQEDLITKAKSYEEENNRLANEIEKLREDIAIKEKGLEPLFLLAETRYKEIMELFEKFKEAIGDENRMKDLKPIFENEIELTKRLLETRKALLKNSVLLNDGATPAPIQTLPKSAPKFDAVSAHTTQEKMFENAIVPEKYRDLPPEIYNEVVEKMKYLEGNDEVYWQAFDNYVETLKRKKRTKTHSPPKEEQDEEQEDGQEEYRMESIMEEDVDAESGELDVESPY